MIGEYVESPGGYKYGIILALMPRDRLEILWEGHEVPYTCNPGSGKVVDANKVPLNVRLQLQQRLKQILEESIQSDAA